MTDKKAALNHKMQRKDLRRKNGATQEIRILEYNHINKNITSIQMTTRRTRQRAISIYVADAK